MFLVFHRTYLMPRGVFDDIIRDHAGWKLAALREDENTVKISREVQAGSEASSTASACEKKNSAHECVFVGHVAALSLLAWWSAGLGTLQPNPIKSPSPGAWLVSHGGSTRCAYNNICARQHTSLRLYLCKAVSPDAFAAHLRESCESSSGNGSSTSG